MDKLWTWGGRFFGYRRGDRLYTSSGECVGRFSGEEIYGKDGMYLGELRNSRLITNLSKAAGSGPAAPYAQGSAIAPFVDNVSYVMVAGYEDFPTFE